MLISSSSPSSEAAKQEEHWLGLASGISYYHSSTVWTGQCQLFVGDKNNWKSDYKKSYLDKTYIKSDFSKLAVDKSGKSSHYFYLVISTELDIYFNTSFSSRPLPFMPCEFQTLQPKHQNMNSFMYIVCLSTIFPSTSSMECPIYLSHGYRTLTLTNQEILRCSPYISRYSLYDMKLLVHVGTVQYRCRR